MLELQHLIKFFISVLSSINYFVMSDYNENLHNNANPSTYENAHNLRMAKTKAEQKLWQSLRNKKLLNLKFRRQHPYGNYVLDFYCHEIKLCIEADGGIHNEKYIKAYDAERTKVLNENEITVLRFTNKEILETITGVTDKIEAFVQNRKEIEKK
jgi:very-short-patch-repair endonuclease